MAMRLAGWAPYVWLGVNVVYLAVYNILAGRADIQRRLMAMALIGAGFWVASQARIARTGGVELGTGSQ